MGGRSPIYTAGIQATHVQRTTRNAVPTIWSVDTWHVIIILTLCHNVEVYKTERLKYATPMKSS
jgi:hypothetical protein